MQENEQSYVGTNSLVSICGMEVNLVVDVIDCQ